MGKGSELGAQTLRLANVDHVCLRSESMPVQVPAPWQQVSYSLNSLKVVI